MGSVLGCYCCTPSERNTPAAKTAAGTADPADVYYPQLNRKDKADYNDLVKECQRKEAEDINMVKGDIKEAVKPVKAKCKQIDPDMARLALKHLENDLSRRMPVDEFITELPDLLNYDQFEELNRSARPTYSQILNYIIEGDKVMDFVEILRMRDFLLYNNVCRLCQQMEAGEVIEDMKQESPKEPSQAFDKPVTASKEDMEKILKASMDLLDTWFNNRESQNVTSYRTEPVSSGLQNLIMLEKNVSKKMYK